MINNTLEAKEALINSSQPVEDIINVILHRKWDEGQYLEYKNGSILDDAKKAKDIIREYATSFANSEGGILIIGVDDKTKNLTGIKQEQKQSWEEWVYNVLQNIAPYFMPAPRVHCINIHKRTAIVIACERAPQLIPCITKSKLTYHLRFGDSTLECPEYLVADLLLGRKQKPILELIVNRIDCVMENNSASITIPTQVSNNSLVASPEVEIGLICWSLEDKKGNIRNDYIKRFIELTPPSTNSDIVFTPKHLTSRRNSSLKPKPIGTFETTDTGSIGKMKLPFNSTFSIKAGMYVMPMGHSPEWYQLETSFELTNQSPTAPIKHELKRMHGERPMVSIEHTQNK